MTKDLVVDIRHVEQRLRPTRRDPAVHFDMQSARAASRRALTALPNAADREAPRLSQFPFAATSWQGSTASPQGGSQPK